MITVPNRWDIFARVVDNFGDAGVSWRLARQLAVEHGRDVIFRARDLEEMARLLVADGHHVAAFDFNSGLDPADKIVSTHPHTSGPVLKFWLGDFVSTSIGIIVTRGAG